MSSIYNIRKSQCQRYRQTPQWTAKKIIIHITCALCHAKIILEAIKAIEYTNKQQNKQTNK